jgi:hypothetical protein
MAKSYGKIGNWERRIKQSPQIWGEFADFV